MIWIGVVPVLEVGHWVGAGKDGWDRGFEEWLEEGAWLREMLLPRVQKILHPLGWGNEQVYLGREGWLFYRPDVEHLTGSGFLNQQGADDPLKALLDFHRQLAERRIRLLVVPVPGKTSVYAENLSNKASNGLRNPSTLEFYRRLEWEGVEVIDLLPELLRAKFGSAQPLFLASDTHWSPAGMQLAARLLAESIRPWLDSEPTSSDFKRRKTEVENRGDTARMLPFDEDSHPVAPEKVSVQTVADNQGNPWQPAAGAPVLLLGDSFANIYSLPAMGWGASAGLAEQLSFELNRPLQRIVLNGQGAWSTRRELQRRLRHGEDLLGETKVVLFQFAARELSFGDWRKIDLGPIGQPAPRPDPGKAAPEGWLEVEGIVAACAELPDASSTPYPDVITSLHLVDLRVRSGNLEDTQIVVFQWARQQGRSMPGERCREGDRVRLRLKKWSFVEADYGRFCRLELDDPRLWDLAVYWAVP